METRPRHLRASRRARIQRRYEGAHRTLTRLGGLVRGGCGNGSPKRIPDFQTCERRNIVRFPHMAARPSPKTANTTQVEGVGLLTGSLKRSLNIANTALTPM